MKEGCYRTPDNSNLLGPSKKVQVPRREFEENSRKLGKRKWDGGGMKLSCTLHFTRKGSKGFIDLLKKELVTKLD